MLGIPSYPTFNLCVNGEAVEAWCQSTIILYILQHMTSLDPYILPGCPTYLDASPDHWQQSFDSAKRRKHDVVPRQGEDTVPIGPINTLEEW